MNKTTSIRRNKTSYPDQLVNILHVICSRPLLIISEHYHKLKSTAPYDHD